MSRRIKIRIFSTLVRSYCLYLPYVTCDQSIKISLRSIERNKYLQA